MMKKPRIKKPLGLRNELIFGAAIAVGLGSMAAPNLSKAEEVQAAETVIVRAQRRGDNPYADTIAPYRIKKSASNLFTEEIIDTPKSVQVLPEELLEDMGVNTMRDLFRTQPGITLGTGEGGNAFGDRIFIRGFDARNDVYIDGVRDPGLGSREMFATQQVEIIKGPSSLFGGRGTTGGAISLVSKQPKSHDSTSIELTLGSDENTRLTVDTNKVINDELAVRVNLMAHNGNIAGRDNVFNNRWGGAIAIEYHPIESLNLGVDYYHLESDYMPDWGMPWDSLIAAPAAVNRKNFYGVGARDFGTTYSDVVSLQADFKYSDNLKLRSVLRYGVSNNEYRATAPEGITIDPISGRRIVGANAKPRFQLTDYLTNQSNLTWDFDTGALKHTLVAGFEVSNEDTRMRSFSFVECGVPPCTGSTVRIFQDLINPNYNYPWNVSGETATGHTKIATETMAIYAIDTIHFGEKWIAMLGIRGDNYKTERNTLNYVTGVAGTPIKSDSDFSSYHAGLVYKPNKNASIYLAYGNSSNPPCEQLDSTGVDYGGCDTLTFAINPIENKSLELGAKFNINGHLDTTAAIYEIRRSGVPSVVRTGQGSSALSTLHAEEQLVRGVEFTASGNITPKLQIAAGFTMFDSNTEKSTNPTSGNLNKPFPNVSEMTFTLTEKYKLNDKWSIGSTWVSQSEKFGGTYSAGSTRLPGFNRLDLMAEYKIKSGLELQFNVQNASDETYYDALYRSGAPYVYIAPGRSYSIMIDWHF